jgi:hypothetical protein
MDLLELATAIITLLAAILSLVAVNRAVRIVTKQEVGRKARAGRDQNIAAKQGE